jgi:type I restriction-modification system DNA methylase subunit
MTEAAIVNHASFIWSVADLRRGDLEQSEYAEFRLAMLRVPREAIKCESWIVKGQ